MRKRGAPVVVSVWCRTTPGNVIWGKLFGNSGVSGVRNGDRVTSPGQPLCQRQRQRLLSARRRLLRRRFYHVAFESSTLACLLCVSTLAALVGDLTFVPASLLGKLVTLRELRRMVAVVTLCRESEGVVKKASSDDRLCACCYLELIQNAKEYKIAYTGTRLFIFLHFIIFLWENFVGHSWRSF